MKSINPTIFLVSLLLISITTTNKNYSATANNDLISATCMKTINPQLCEHIIRTHPEARQLTSLRSLGEFCMYYAIGRARTLIEMFDRFLSVKLDMGREAHTACRNLYAGARDMLTAAKNHFIEDQYELAKEQSLIASRMPDDCRSFYTDNSAPSVRLRKANDEAKAIFNMAFTIARELHQPRGH